MRGGSHDNVDWDHTRGGTHSQPDPTWLPVEPTTDLQFIRQEREHRSKINP